MTYKDIDINICEETMEMLKVVKRFSMEVMRPAGIALDRLADPADVIAEGSPWPCFHHAKCSSSPGISVRTGRAG